MEPQPSKLPDAPPSPPAHTHIPHPSCLKMVTRIITAPVTTEWLLLDQCDTPSTVFLSPWPYLGRSQCLVSLHPKLLITAPCLPK